MSRAERPLSPHLQVYRPQITSVLSVLHRGTGIILSMGVLVLLYWLISIASGEEAYTNAYVLLASLPLKIFYFGLCFCFFYHFANGIRHLIWDIGIGLDRDAYRKSGWCVVVFSIAAASIYSIIFII